MADIIELPPPKKKSRVSKYPHGQPRDPDQLLEIARLRNEEKLQWRAIGPKVRMSAQGACLLYNLWRRRGWFGDLVPDEPDESGEPDESNESA